jgi:hypothetical protein
MAASDHVTDLALSRSWGCGVWLVTSKTLPLAMLCPALAPGDMRTYDRPHSVVTWTTLVRVAIPCHIGPSLVDSQ